MRGRAMVVPVLLLAAACGASRVEPGNVAVGTWGGEEAGLLVRADGTHAHIGCTYGDVAGPIPFDADGGFDVAARWNVSAFPIDRGVFHDARMSGRLRGRSVTFSARLSDTGQVLGPVVVTLGREPTMANCPICRTPTAPARVSTGPGAADPVIIQVRKGGYAPDFEEQVARPAPAVLPGAAPARAIARVRPAALLVAAAVSVLALAAAWRGGLIAPHREASAVSVAVLPFAHYSTSAADELLAARLTDGVTSELARTGAVSVVSHTSARQYTRPRGPLREIAQALGADLVMEATVLTEGDRLRIQARLVDGARDRKLWVEEFVGSAGDPAPLQRRIAAAVAAAANRPRRH